MEKILYVTDAVKLNRPCLDFACYISNLTHSKLTGVFLENQILELRSSEAIQEIAISPAVPGASLEGQKELYRDENIDLFKHVCENNGVNCFIHQDTGMPVTEVVAESRYTDLIVVDATTSFSWRPEIAPTVFVKEVLEKSECPVIIAPEDFEGVNEIIFTYNGSSSSVFAIKQFTHLFPQLRDRKITVLSITDAGKPIKGDKDKLKEWLQAHYDQITFVVLEDRNVRARLLEYLVEKEQVFIVMGAFGRSILSNVIIPNPADPIVKLITQPIFITHY
ncbi:hypothetical protein ACDQ55_15535 [Chitinophaga sp. 30R24]|uniref:hypothetical protein n=1 Tax=Chitinophaga sp. 30R24 TaxID=3248838 RepID=UPI003B920B49